MANNKKKVGAGWLRTSQNGDTQYISIVISGGLSPDINLVMFKNGYKNADQQPDYIVYLSSPREASKAATAQQGAADFPEPDSGGDETPF